MPALGVGAGAAPVRLVGHGLAACCLQHETDPLDGHLYLQRLSTEERTRVFDEYHGRLN